MLRPSKEVVSVGLVKLEKYKSRDGLSRLMVWTGNLFVHAHQTARDIILLYHDARADCLLTSCSVYKLLGRIKHALSCGQATISQRSMSSSSKMLVVTRSILAGSKASYITCKMWQPDRPHLHNSPRIGTIQDLMFDNTKSKVWRGGILYEYPQQRTAWAVE